MSLTEISLNIPTEHVANVFGQFDAYIKKIERTLNVTVVVRGDSMKLIGNERQIKSASNVFMQLLELSKRGNVITEQNVNYPTTWKDFCVTTIQPCIDLQKKSRKK